ncbi:xanthine dehydrogenase family protein molybdopterin-binding subunit [Nocardiopsis sp. CA-288880]|uniref:xanthine dehydrogenase family protein molybdopterin-binding subunit n=1 Tax=Nocardiopsis sp. CA-288880 TaxID=3239995 RepID=UPI003D964E55
MNTPIGSDVARVDGRLKVTGAARYTADHPVDRAAAAHVVVSAIARGRVRAMHVDEARRQPGVIAVYTPLAPLPIHAAPGFGENYAPLQDREVRFRGQIIGLVVAETAEQARDAAARVTVEYEEAPARTSLSAGLPGLPSPGMSPDGPSPNPTLLAPGVDTIDDALRASAVVVETTVEQEAQSHVAMEPHGITAVWQGDDLTVYSGSQAPQMYAMLLATRIGIPPDRVRVVSPFVGGGFGSRVPVWSEAALAAVAARELARPVRLALTREQSIVLSGHRPMMTQRVRLGADRDGTLNAVSHESAAELPAVGGWPEIPATETTGVLYRTRNLAIDQRLVTMDTPPTWAMRAPNEAPGAFALETAMDELAVALDMDPLELRLRNYTTTVPSSGQAWTSKRLDECYRIGAERFGWEDRDPVPGSRVDGDWLVGVGMASAVYPAHAEPWPVRMQLRDSGTVVVSASTPDIGTGTYTVASIVASDALGVPIERVTAELGDSALPASAPAAGSRAAGALAPAIQSTSRVLIAALLDLAVRTEGSPFRGLDPSALTYREGRVEAGADSASFAELLGMARLPAVEATTPVAEPSAARLAAHGFGAHFCEVRVNRFTGEPRVSRFTSVFDVGRVLSARTARSQFVGAVVFGIGGALLEANPVEESGRFAAGNLGDYLVAVNADVPPIDVTWLDYSDTAFSATGARGLGELGTVGSAAAVGNAVFNATGIRVRDLPITLDKLIGRGETGALHRV